jgi:dolichyl-phosphate beta-glucosyltransferase
MILSIVIPCYNEAKRLSYTLNLIREAQAKSELPTLSEIIVVDDGSTDNMNWDIIRKRVSFVMHTPRRCGKGSAVRAGLQLANGDHVLICDADASTPFAEYNRLASGNPDASVGSRGLPQSIIPVRQPGLRHFWGRLFNLYVRAVTGLPFKDTQCGFKLLSRKAVDAVKNELSVNNFAWDIQLLKLLEKHNFKVREVPITWFHRENSRVRFWRDGLAMLWTVLWI